MHTIKTYNKIAASGLEILAGKGYTVDENAADAQGIILRSHKLQPEEITTSVLGIARAGAGYNNVPVDHCSEHGIVVFNTPGANANGVKELVIAGMLLSSRQVYPALAWAQSIKDQGEDVPKMIEKEKSRFAGPEIAGKTLGIIGLGAIGVLVANSAIALGMRVIGYDPFLSVESAWGMSAAVEKATNPDQVYQQADYLTIHVPQNDKTKGMINAEVLAKMKDDARILNFARGGLVDNAAVLAALDAGTLGAYVTDFPDASLLGRDDVIAIPHLGASTPESEENCAIMAANQLDEFLTRGNIINSVNFPACSMPMTTGFRLTVSNRNVPKMVGQITTVLADAGINIEDMMNRHRDELAYNIIDVDGPVSDSVVTSLQAIDGVIAVRVISS
ncbi:phosphoglycerate dehydrogenase [Spirochaeta africana]|uniref:D-3-phosphoglycerate dehydrogenase n=1 Tax=Spirochaeta africana (strain ATCC 700263 / DSM 8902 / Z-7692) TaxID=889378 RepID=H9UMI8_SPIAZ|nr:phosphoglycerate dehydrogenase [Spirochaeta africana]AFG38731.1 phosphoglycerate dehydrogenase-like oxidoreductase [Spirochaeta africana DSM 8902]